MTMRQAKPLAELLLERKLVTPAQLQSAQAQATTSGQPLQRVLIQQGVVPEAKVMTLVAEQSSTTTLDLSNYRIKPEVVQLIPEALARKHMVMPVFKIGDQLTVAIEDPLNFLAIDALRLKTQCQIKTVLAGASHITQAIDQYYGATGTIAEVAQAIHDASEPPTDEAAAAEAPIIRLVDLLIMQAMKERASDIHIEPGHESLRTRFRVDGVLLAVKGPSVNMHSAVVSRVKVLAHLDIAEKRKPQDGRFRLELENKEIDLRVSTIPTQFGEKVVMRLLDSASMSLTLKQLGLDEQTRVQFEPLIRLPHGIVLVTGPTGSGKTTTLYASLSLVNSVEKNVITVEDPVEYQLPGVNQVHVNPKADVTFASALRSFLRQDPDIIMVGEIRDQETAEIAIQAALTGHLVFSTLHTNDAASSLTRLIEMGVEPFLVASSVVGVLAQRLVRVLCLKCKASYQPSADEAQQLGVSVETSLFRAPGCAMCKQAGYKGRHGIFELLTLDEAIKQHIIAKAPAHLIRETARTAQGFRSLRDDGIAKAVAGVTTVEEVLRVTQLE